MKEILERAAEIWGIAPEDIVGRSRLAHISEARSAFCFVASRDHFETLREIGQFLDGRHHSTVHHMIQAADNWTETNPSYCKRMISMREGVPAPSPFEQMVEEASKHVLDWGTHPKTVAASAMLFVGYRTSEVLGKLGALHHSSSLARFWDPGHPNHDVLQKCVSIARAA